MRDFAEIWRTPDDEDWWLVWGGKGTYEGGWGSSGSMKGVSSTGCQTLLLQGPLEGRSSVEVTTTEGMPDCPSGNAEVAEACYTEQKEEMIRGPWKYEFDVSGH